MAEVRMIELIDVVIELAEIVKGMNRRIIALEEGVVKRTGADHIQTALDYYRSAKGNQPSEDLPDYYNRPPQGF